MKDDESLLLLLQLIRVNGNTMYLLEHGFTLYDLSQAIDSLKNRGLVCVNEKGGLKTTQTGESFFFELNRKLGRRGLYRYLGKQQAYINEQMPLNMVYVPCKKEKG